MSDFELRSPLLDPNLELILNEIRTFAFRAGYGDFCGNSFGESFDVAADQAAPAQGSHFFELGNELKGVVGAFSNEIEDGLESF